jgi:hypothetical protein
LAALLYRNQWTEGTGWLDDAMVQRAAKSTPGSTRTTPRRHELRGRHEQGRHERPRDAAAELQQTPTFYIGTANGKLVPVVLGSSVDDTTLPNAIDAALR